MTKYDFQVGCSLESRPERPRVSNPQPSGQGCPNGHLTAYSRALLVKCVVEEGLPAD